MPAPIPPGYMRGPIVMMASTDDHLVAESLHQWLWREAGGYGARLVLLTVESTHIATLAALRSQLASWECDQIDEFVALDRKSARTLDHTEAIEQATGIIIVGDDPFRLASTLGGTPLAQAIRRANARGKLVAAIGASSAFLCQHMIRPGSQADAETLRTLVTFGAGLGLVNRLVIDGTSAITSLNSDSQRHLLAAVASNPFLISVGLESGSAAILYPDNTLQANGPNPMTIVDGQAIEAADFDSPKGTVVGALYYTLHTGDGFNLDDHSLRPVGEIDLPPTGPVTSVF